MKKNLFVISILLIIFVGCGGGSSVDSAINKVDKAIEQLEKKKGNVTEEDWANIQKEVEEPMKIIADAMENNKVGAMTKLKIITVTAKWATVVSEAGLNEMGKRMGDMGKELENASKELNNTLKDMDSTSKTVPDSTK